MEEVILGLVIAIFTIACIGWVTMLIMMLGKSNWKVLSWLVPLICMIAVFSIWVLSLFLLFQVI